MCGPGKGMANTRGVNDDLDAHNDAGAAVELLPAWFAARMLGTRGSYGFLLATGDVVRVSRVTAIHVSSSGSILIDVLLDHAGVPDGVDMAWRTKHFLGAPVPAANLATLNLVQIVMVIEFKAAQIAETAEMPRARPQMRLASTGPSSPTLCPRRMSSEWRRARRKRQNARRSYGLWPDRRPAIASQTL
jgi:hypothetical protein